MQVEISEIPRGNAVTSIYFLFGDQLIAPASVKLIHFVSKNDQERCRDQYDADDD